MYTVEIGEIVFLLLQIAIWIDILVNWNDKQMNKHIVFFLFVCFFSKIWTVYILISILHSRSMKMIAYN
jgi:hypothetical protein